jgi:V/A-type H+-transporting ATPase subunit I
MPISKMLKVQIIAHGDRKGELIDTLHELGLVQIEDLTERLETPGWAEVLREEEAAVTSELDQQIAGIRYAIDFVLRFETTTQNLIESFFSPKYLVDEQEYESTVKNFDFKFIDRCRELDAELTRLKTEETRLYTLYEEMFPWEQLDMSLEELETPHTITRLGRIPLENDELLQHIARDHPCTYVTTVNTTEKEKFVAVLHLKSESEELLKKLRTCEFSSVSFEGLTGRVPDQMEYLMNSLEETRKKREQVEETCTELLKEQLSLMIMHDHLTNMKAKKEVKENFVRTDKVFVVEGWVSRRQVDALRDGLSSIREVEIYTEEPAEDEEVPVELRNPGRLIRPFELVTRIYGLPHYREVDPTLSLAPFFIVFFGLCLSDVFYGVLLMVLSLFALKKIKMGPDGDLLFKLLIIAGGVTVVCGFLLGGWFGNLTEYMPGQLAVLETVRQKLTVLNPIENPLGMLAIVLLMGIVHVWFGILIKMYMSIRDQDYSGAVFDQGLWLVLIPFGTLMVLKSMFEVDIPADTAVQYVVIGCLVGLVLTQGRYQKGGNIVTSAFKKLFVGLISIYNIFGYLGDVLSYSRVLALGLATGAIAIVFNNILSMIAESLPYIGLIVAIILFPILHLFNLIINALGAFIHPGRLQYVEFFTKFLEGGGEDFRPFQFDSKYIKVREYKGKGG